eukprot:1386150-Amphidinium_carterae.1
MAPDDLITSNECWRKRESRDKAATTKGKHFRQGGFDQKSKAHIAIKAHIAVDSQCRRPTDRLWALRSTNLDTAATFGML